MSADQRRSGLLLPAKEAVAVAAVQAALASAVARREAAKGIDPALATQWAINTTSAALLWLLLVLPPTALIVLFVSWTSPIGWIYKIIVVAYCAMLAMRWVLWFSRGAGVRASYGLPTAVIAICGALWTYVAPLAGWICWMALS